MRHGAARTLVMNRLHTAWDLYLEQVLEECLLPHAGEAAANVYDCLATWVLGRLHQGARGVTEVLAHCRVV